MKNPIQQFRDKATTVRYRYSAVPIDHEDTAFKQQILVSFATFIPLMIFILWLLSGVPKEHEAALLLPMLIAAALSYAAGQLFYIERMYRLIEKFCPGSFTLAVAPALF